MSLSLKKWIIGGGVGAVTLLLAFLLGYSHLFGPASGADMVPRDFIVEPDESVEEVVQELRDTGLIKSGLAFRLAFLRHTNGKGVRAGGYTLAPSMDAWTVAKTLTDPPLSAFVTVPPGLRKEEIAELFVETFDWTEEQKQEWLAASVIPNFDEGVYFADTYLIPASLPPTEVAERLQTRFQDMTQEAAEEARRQNIRWSTVLTLASLVEREAARNDKALVAGILWNRLENNWMLQVDASLQYVRGNDGRGWWAAPKSEDKYLESPFNTYQHVGLPPHPIASPSLASIEAVLNPESTGCYFYLHDPRGRIHCSRTYSGHVANVNRYLR